MNTGVLTASMGDCISLAADCSSQTRTPSRVNGMHAGAVGRRGEGRRTRCCPQRCVQAVAHGRLTAFRQPTLPDRWLFLAGVARRSPEPVACSEPPSSREFVEDCVLVRAAGLACVADAAPERCFRVGLIRRTCGHRGTGKVSEGMVERELAGVVGAEAEGAAESEFGFEVEALGGAGGVAAPCAKALGWLIRRDAATIRD